MTELEQKVADLQKAESDLKLRQEELAKLDLSIRENQDKKAALDSEVARVQADIAKAKDARRNEDQSFQNKLHTENLNTASQKVFSELGIKPEDQAKFLEGFKSDSVSADAIAGELRAKYAHDHADELLAVKRKADELSAGSDTIKAAFSSAAFGGVGLEQKNQDQGLDADDIAAARMSGMSVERYRELKVKNKW